MKELKIIFKTNQDVLTTSDIILCADNDQIGCIQNIKLNINAEHETPELEITFPKLEGFPKTMKDYVSDNIEKLSQFKNIKIIMED